MLVGSGEGLTLLTSPPAPLSANGEGEPVGNHADPMV